MLSNYLQIYSRSIVLVGDFTPTQFQPAWLAAKGLIRESEADSANIHVIHKDLVRFEIDWLFFEAKRDRVEIRTQKEPYFETLRDLIVGICRLLRNTKAVALGINHTKHFSLPNKDKLYEFGNRIAPLYNWQNDILKEPRVLSVEIIDFARYDGFSGSSRIRVYHEPAIPVPFPVSIDYNDHYNLTDIREAEKILTDQWITSAEITTNLIENLWQKLKI